MDEKQIMNENAENNPQKNLTETSKAEWEQLVEDMMRRTYLNGLSVGMKTMCGSVLNEMNGYQKENMNPQKQLMRLRQLCEKCLDTVSDSAKSDSSEDEANEG